MKTRSKNKLALCLLAGALCACASPGDTSSQRDKAAENVYDPKFPVYTQAAPTKTGEMAYVVERQAKASGCEPADNASLMARRPGIQFYRVPCADGRSVLYKCEMRQCGMAD